MKYLPIILSLVMTAGMASCQNNKEASVEKAQTIIMDPLTQSIQDIEKYLKDNDITAQKTESNIYYVINREGDGTHPTIQDQIEIHYKGYYLDGEQFDSSYDRNETIVYPLSGFIDGWKLGIPKISRGGAGTLYVPSNLGYGSNPPPGIRSNAVLVFDVELFKINNK